MIINLRIAVQVRVPDDRLPFGNNSAVFHTFQAETPVNYSSEKSGASHMVHRFVVNHTKWGFLRHSTVTLINDRPAWL